MKCLLSLRSDTDAVMCYCCSSTLYCKMSGQKSDELIHGNKKLSSDPDSCFIMSNVHETTRSPADFCKRSRAKTGGTSLKQTNVWDYHVFVYRFYTANSFSLREPAAVCCRGSGWSLGPTISQWIRLKIQVQESERDFFATQFFFVNELNWFWAVWAEI